VFISQVYREVRPVKLFIMILYFTDI